MYRLIEDRVYIILLLSKCLTISKCSLITVHCKPQLFSILSLSVCSICIADTGKYSSSKYKFYMYLYVKITSWKYVNAFTVWNVSCHLFTQASMHYSCPDLTHFDLKKCSEKNAHSFLWFTLYDQKKRAKLNLFEVALRTAFLSSKPILFLNCYSEDTRTVNT